MLLGMSHTQVCVSHSCGYERRNSYASNIKKGAGEYAAGEYAAGMKYDYIMSPGEKKGCIFLICCHHGL